MNIAKFAKKLCAGGKLSDVKNATQNSWRA